MNPRRHNHQLLEKVLLNVSSLDGGTVKFVCYGGFEKKYGIEYNGVMVFEPDTFEKTNRYIWSEFLD